MSPERFDPFQLGPTWRRRWRLRALPEPGRVIRCLRARPTAPWMDLRSSWVPQQGPSSGHFTCRRGVHQTRLRHGTVDLCSTERPKDAQPRETQHSPNGRAAAARGRKPRWTRLRTRPVGGCGVVRMDLESWLDARLASAAASGEGGGSQVSF